LQKEIIIAVLKKDGLLVVATIIDMIETALRELHSSNIKKVSIMERLVRCKVRRLTPWRCLDALTSLQEEMITEALEKDSLFTVATIIDMIESTLWERHNSNIKKLSMMERLVSCEVRRLTPLRCLDALKP
jgi:PBP1b-binding outer membrane lipoprotein LpoB